MNLIINFTEKRGEACPVPIPPLSASRRMVVSGKNRCGVVLEIKDGKKLIDCLTFEFETNLDSVLISAVDKILKRNRIETLSLKTVKVAGEVDKFSSAYKIAQTFIEAIKASK